MGQTYQGVCAGVLNPSKVTGKALVAGSPREANKIREGDILITRMTNVDFIMAMRTAGAIVTFNGGRLCHAAIVARELGKVCVVACSSLEGKVKTGDQVTIELDGANRVGFVTVG